MTKEQQREEIKKAMLKFKKPIKVITKDDELRSLSNDYTDYSMRCGECGIYERD